MKEIIRTENIGYSYVQKHIALEGITLAINQGEIFSVIGSNGSGKSTLLHILCGLLLPTSGKLWFKGNSITENVLKDASFNDFFRASIGYVFQNSDSQLFCPTVFDELVFGPLQMGNDMQTATERAELVMELLNITNLRNRPTYMLSGGEKKRVAIASVLTLNPDVLLIDEPMSGLDPKTRSFVIELILKLNEAGKTIIIATHHLELVSHLQSRVAVLSEQHRIEKTGSAEEILSDTDLLIRTNLIHEHWHKHGNISHKHLSTGFLFHKHP